MTGATLAVRVQPGARASGWAGRLPDGRLKVRVTAPPVDGRANDALVRFVADSLGLARHSVRLAHGAGGRDKVLDIDLEPGELQARLAGLEATDVRARGAKR